MRIKMAQFFRFIHLAVLNHFVVLSSLPDYRSYQNGFVLHLTLIPSLTQVLMAVSVLMAGHLDSYGAVVPRLRN